MTHGVHRSLALGTALGVLLGLAGCGSLFRSHAPPTSIYLLSATAAGTSTDMPFDLAVLKPRIRTGLGTDRIAVLYPDRRLDYYADARWSGPLEEVVQDLALQAFRNRVRLRTLHTDGSAFGSGYWLEIDVVDFQAEYAVDSAAMTAAAPAVHVHLLGRLGSSGERRVIGRFEADERMQASENRLTTIVDAYNRAADAALGKIVALTIESLTSASESR